MEIIWKGYNMVERRHTCRGAPSSAQIILERVIYLTSSYDKGFLYLPASTLFGEACGWSQHAGGASTKVRIQRTYRHKAPPS